jgi:hypothetical protein
MKYSGYCMCGYETPLVANEKDIDWALLDWHQVWCEIRRNK